MPLSRITSLFQSATANVYSPSANTVAIRTSSTDRFTVASGGDVGIGTTSPAQTLHVKTSTASGPITLGVLSNSTTLPALSLNGAYASTTMAGIYSNGVAASNLYYTVPASQSHFFAIADSTKMTLDSAGNLGLGVTPSAWSSGKAIETGSLGTGTWGASGANYTVAGYYYNSGDKFAITGNYAMYSSAVSADGTFRWYSSTATGTAGNAATISERMRLDASGILLVGTTSASASLAAGGLQVTDRICVGTGSVGTPSLHASGDTNTGLYFPGADIVGFATGGTERARITSGGEFLIGKTSATLTTAGGLLYSGYGSFTRALDPVLSVNRLTSDGTLVSFYQDSAEEGSISVSGTTVSYNGGHLARWSQLLSGQRDESIVKGTVLSNLDEMCEWLDAEGNPLPNEQLNRMKVSDVDGDTNVAGVFVNWDNDDQDNPYDMNIAMTGDMIIRIAQGVTVQKGDLLMSAGDGTAKPQGDDIVRSKTVAKVTSNHVTCTYEDGSYCVPCVLMAC